MKVDIAFVHAGIVGDLVIGTVTMTTTEPVVIVDVFVKVTENPFLAPVLQTYRNYCNVDESDIRGSAVSFEHEVLTFPCIGFPTNLHQEFPPGKWVFDFSYLIPKNLPPSIWFPSQKLGVLYNATGFVLTPSGRHSSASIKLPLLFTLATPSLMPVEYSERSKQVYLTVRLPVQSYPQGSRINVQLFMASPKPIPPIILSLVSIFTQDTHAIPTTWAVQQVAALVTEQQSETCIQLTVPTSAPPSATFLYASLRWFVVVTLRDKKKKSMLVPIEVTAPVPPNPAQIADYATAFGSRVFLDPLPDYTDGIARALPPAVRLAGPGVEPVVLVTGRRVLVDHFRRTVAEENGATSDVPYLYPESLHLPPGVVMGIFQRRPFFYDCTTNTSTYRDHWATETQAVWADCVNATFTIRPLRIEGVSLESAKKTPAVRMSVWAGGKELTAKTVEPGCDGTFDGPPLAFPVPRTRRFVRVVFTDAQRLLSRRVVGTVTFDLTKLPFEAAYERWHVFQASDGGDETYTGRVLLWAAYHHRSTAAASLPTVRLPFFLSQLWTASYPRTDAMRAQEALQRDVRAQRRAAPVVACTPQGEVVPAFLN